MAAPFIKLSWNICRITPANIRCLTRPMSRLYPTDDEMYTRTTVNLLSKDEHAQTVPLINNYGVTGFTISGDTVVGPVAILPRCFVNWNVGSFTDINEDSLSLFHLIEPKIEILVIGVGAENRRLDPGIHTFLRRKSIALEVQDTGNACATFNFLVNEGRIVAAGLIPPELKRNLPITQQLPKY